MRQIGIVANQAAAQRLAAYLYTKGISSQINAEATPENPADGSWSVWVYNEDRVAEGREDFQRFLQDPEAEEFLEAEGQALRILHEKLQQRKPQVVDLKETWQRPPVLRAPLAMFLIFACLLVAAATDLGDDLQQPLMQNLFICSFTQTGQLIQWNGLSEIKSGEIWRLFTPALLHFSLLHILFNLLWVYDLGVQIEYRRGSWRFLLLVLVIAGLSNFSQYWWVHLSSQWFPGEPAEAPMIFGGMSGVVYGLLGYVWMKSRYSPVQGLYLTPNTVMYSLVFLVACMVGVMGRIANGAHLSGFVLGIGLGLVKFL